MLDDLGGDAPPGQHPHGQSPLAQLTIWLPKHWKDALRARGKADDRSMSHLAARYIQEGLARDESR